jgi:hypothetical protein
VTDDLPYKMMDDPNPFLHLKTLGPAFRATNSIPTGIFIRVFCCRESVRLALPATNWDRSL